MSPKSGLGSVDVRGLCATFGLKRWTQFLSKTIVEIFRKWYNIPSQILSMADGIWRGDWPGSLGYIYIWIYIHIYLFLVGSNFELQEPFLSLSSADIWKDVGKRWSIISVVPFYTWFPCQDGISICTEHTHIYTYPCAAGNLHDVYINKYEYIDIVHTEREICIYEYTWCFLASTAGSQRCWLNIHRYFHFSLSLSLYIYTYMVTTLRTEVNTIPQCPVTAPMSKSQGWTLDEHFSSNIYIYIFTNYRFENTKIQSNIWVEPQMWTLEEWNVLKKESSRKCSCWTFFVKLWVGPQMWTSEVWVFLFKDSTWKCSFLTFFVKLWVGPQMWTLEVWSFLFKDSTWKCSFWTLFVKMWVGPQMWTLEMWNFLFKDSTWKCSFWTFFIKLWVGPQMWTLADWNFLFKDSTWKCSFWTFFIKLWVGPQMWTLAGWNFLFKDSTWKCSFWTFLIKFSVGPQMWILDIRI